MVDAPQEMSDASAAECVMGGAEDAKATVPEDATQNAHV